jgi:hypothetical protein
MNVDYTGLIEEMFGEVLDKANGFLDDAGIFIEVENITVGLFKKPMVTLRIEARVMVDGKMKTVAGIRPVELGDGWSVNVEGLRFKRMRQRFDHV